MDSPGKKVINMIMKLIALILIQFSALSLIAQTTSTAPATLIQDPLVVSNSTQAAGALLHYAVPGIGFDNAVELAGSLMAILLVGARYLRKLIPDKLQANTFGLVLAHLGGEMNPTITKLAQAAIDPKMTPPGSISSAVPIPTTPAADVNPKPVATPITK